MMPRSASLGLPLGAVLVLSSIARAQSARVALEVTEKTGGLFESAFSAAFRSLGDVVVVTPSEAPSLIVRVVVMCQPDRNDCASASTYVVAIDLAEPIDTAAVRSVIVISDSTLQRRLNGPKHEAATAELAKRTSEAMAWLSGYEQEEMLWTIEWGRNVYQRLVSELVAKIDRGCLEPMRIMNRWSVAFAARDSAMAANLMQRYHDILSASDAPCH